MQQGENKKMDFPLCKSYKMQERDMKEIKAIIQPYRLTRIRDDLSRIPDFPGMTVADVRGCSGNLEQMQARSQNKRTELDELTDYSNKVEIKILAPDEMVHQIVKIIGEDAKSGQLGDGILWITPVDAFYRIRKDPIE